MFRTVVVLALLAASAEGQSPDRVTFAVAGLFHSSTFQVEATPSQPLAVHAGGREFLVGHDSRQLVTITRLGNQLHLRAKGVNITVDSADFSGQSGDADFMLSIPSRFHRHYRGSLSISAHNGVLAPVVTMDLETAVASIVASEAPAGAPLEALKALAVASRSYLAAAGPRHGKVDFCDTTHCQFLRQPPPANSLVIRAAAETHGLVLTFSSKPLAAMYSASCGGRTHTLADLGLRQHDYPYYAVECPYCRHHPDKWSLRIAQSDVASIPKGEWDRLQLARKLGWNVIPSNSFESKHTNDGVELTGVGHGHGLGLCERGATAMARDGRNFRAILAHYYPNTLVESLRR